MVHSPRRIGRTSPLPRRHLVDEPQSVPGHLSGGDVLMDCDWPAMMAMIRDLEERIAGETETDTTYGVYVSRCQWKRDLNMWYDCLVLRDSIEALQVTYDEALAPRVTVDAAVVLSDTSAALSASFSGSGVDASGFAWAEDLRRPQTTGDDTGTSSPIADTLTDFGRRNDLITSRRMRSRRLSLLW